VCKKDKYGPNHSEEIPIPNLEVMALLKSFKSKGYCRETFNWQYYYYYLTEEGITYLRSYLALPDEIVPATLKSAASARPAGRIEDEKKSTAPGGSFKPEFSYRGGGYGIKA
jgi:small subunit ribosomal protein S10e